MSRVIYAGDGIAVELGVLRTGNISREPYLSDDGTTIAVEVDLPEEGVGEHMTGILRAVAEGGFEMATPPRHEIPGGDPPASS